MNESAPTSTLGLLIGEVKSLREEATLLRAEIVTLTKDALPREEHDRYRRLIARIAIGAAIGLAAVIGVMLYAINANHNTQKDLGKVAYNSCVAREQREAAQAPAVAEINALLNTLASTEKQLAVIDSPAGRAVRERRVKGFERYQAYVAQATKAPPGPKPPPCDSYLK